jgi:glyoxylase-like metal-dependent hydrolase (beta-lactamase superfamily II)
MKDTAIDGLHFWSEYQPDRRIDFHGWIWRRAEGNLAFDPLPLDEADVRWLENAGGLRWIVLTNADHVRASESLAARFGAEVLAPQQDRDRFGARAEHVTSWFGDDLPLPPALADALSVHWLRGGKSEFEAAFYLRSVRALLFGDAVRSHATGTLRLLPNDKLRDRARLVADVLALRDLPIEAILLGDGDPILCGARNAWLAFLRELGRAT